jgi:metal-dependent hydrolase (beta-lactamase superfamily II)
MLKSGEIELMVLSHWHLDHYWGIESTLEAQPEHQDVGTQNVLSRGHEAAQRRASNSEKQRGPGCPHLQE